MENLYYKVFLVSKKDISCFNYYRLLLQKYFKLFQYSLVHKLILNATIIVCEVHHRHHSPVILHLIANVRFRSDNYKNAISSNWTSAVMYYNCSRL